MASKIESKKPSNIKLTPEQWKKWEEFNKRIGQSLVDNLNAGAVAAAKEKMPDKK
jgi:hypothetical protein